MEIQLKYWITILHATLYLLGFGYKLPAQGCSGNLAKQSYFQTFGSGDNPGPTLSAAMTGLGYTANPCPAEGYYTIQNKTDSCSIDTWYDLIADNTVNDFNGYMMIVNAGSSPALVYLDTARGLCGNTNFAFFAGIHNLPLSTSCGGHPARPRLAFSIETPGGVVLGSYSTGDIPENPPGLFVYAVYFRTPPLGGDLVIRIRDEASGGCGNSFTLDNIEIGACGPQVDAGFGDNMVQYASLCNGDPTSILISGKLAYGYASPNYQWQILNGSDWVDIPGATSLDYLRKATPVSGNFKYRLTAADGNNIVSQQCRVASDYVTVVVTDPPAVTISSNSPVCVNSQVNLVVTGGRIFQWTGPGGFSSTDQNPSFTAGKSSAGQYHVAISDGTGCNTQDSIIVTTIPPPTIVISNNKEICIGDSVGLQAGGGNDYLWTPATGLLGASTDRPMARPVVTTTYTVKVTDSNLCFDTASVVVIVDIKPQVSAGPDKTIVRGQSTTLDGTIAGNASFNWVTSPGLDDIHSLTPHANPLVTTNYILTAASAIGCGAASDTVSVIVYKDLYVPNAFSPNEDGLNDTWQIPMLQSFPNAVVTVFNRYGNKVYQSTGGNVKWDGSYKNAAQPSGAYVYLIHLGNKSPAIKGIVFLVR